MNSISCEIQCAERSLILLHCVMQHKDWQMKMKIISQGVKDLQANTESHKSICSRLHSAQ